MSDRLNALLHQGTASLHDAGITSARNDAQQLLAHAHRVDVSEIAKALVMCTGIVGQQGDPQELEIAEDLYLELIEQRAQRIPLQHLTGTAPFRHVELAVGPGVFVPRPETEAVAQVAIDAIGRGLDADTPPSQAGVPTQTAPNLTAARPIAVDLCTGSGAIAIALATETNAQIFGVELDAAAFEWAQRNVAALASHVQLTHGDARTALPQLDGKVDVVVSNPPYIPPGSVPVDPEVAVHDPQVALYGLGPDGLEVPRGIARAAARLLRPGGIFVMEHAEIQAAAARDLVAEIGGFEQIETKPDLTGRPRMVVARRSGPLGQDTGGNGELGT